MICVRKKTITKLNNNSETITDRLQILEEIESFYETLYCTKLNENYQTNLEQFVDNTPTLPSLTEEEQLLCEGNITLEEFKECLQLFKNNKSPGCDGLSIEFFKTFWKELGPKLVSTFNYSKQFGKMSLSQRRAVITLLHKKER